MDHITRLFSRWGTISYPNDSLYKILTKNLPWNLTPDTAVELQGKWNYIVVISQLDMFEHSSALYQIQ